MLRTIARPFGMLLLWLYELVGSYGWAVILFALIVRLILLPFQWKSKKGMMRVTRLNPKIKELEKRHEGNPRKYQEEVAKLYKEENASPMGGCLWSLIPFPILLALYQAIRMPITIMMGVSSELLAEGGAIYQKLQELGFATTMGSSYEQIAQSQFITEHFSEFAPISDRLIALDYSFLGLNLGSIPQWNFFWNVNWSLTSEWLPALGLFLIPLISAGLTLVSTKLSQASNNPGGTKQASQMQAQMKGMNLIMPLVSIYICFIMPAALGIYWISSSVFTIIQEYVLTRIFKKQLDAEDAERRERDRERQAEIERKRQETERLKLEGKTDRNSNTSKKKLQATKKAEHDAVKAAAAREERQKRRERLGIKEDEKPASQVGNRRYARGRAYVPDRFTNPEGAEEATAAAAAESEFGESIDIDMPDDTTFGEDSSSIESKPDETAESSWHDPEDAADEDYESFDEEIGGEMEDDDYDTFDEYDEDTEEE